MSSNNNSLVIIPEAGTDTELKEYQELTPLLANDTVKRVHMQVVLVHCFYQKPDITNDELTEIIVDRFPDSNWMTDPEGRANADRRKYNIGQFRCMGGWAPKTDDPHYARLATVPDTDPELDPELAEALADLENSNE